MAFAPPLMPTVSRPWRCHRPVINLRALSVLLLGTVCAAQGQSRGAGATRMLQLIDSIRVAEDDTLFLARPFHIVTGPSGHYFVVDGTEARVLEIARSGRIVRAFGRRGRGPGELVMPYSAAIGGDSILAVMDNGQKRVVLYNLHTGRYLRNFLLLGWQPSLQFSGDQLLAGILEVDPGTAVVRLTFTGERISAEGVIPPVIKTHPLLRSGFGAVRFTEAGNAVFAVFEVSQSLFHWRRGARVAEEIPVPTVRRKGVRPDLFDELVRDPSKAAALGYDRSVPMLLSFLSPDILGLVTVDGQITAAGLVGTYALTVIDTGRGRVCPDIEVPAERDPLPQLTLSGDTLVVLQQGLDERGQPTSMIRRFLVRLEGCSWIAVPGR